MDGYALKGEETFGASLYSPAFFRLIGRARPGLSFDGAARPGEAVAIATGAPMPRGCDAVSPLEHSQVTGDALAVFEATPPARHVGFRGEDIRSEARILEAGRVLRPQDLGVLSAVGASQVEVVRGPRVTILVTGDEVLPAGSKPHGHRVSDANSPMLLALVARDGGVGSVVGPLPDDPVLLRDSFEAAVVCSDLLLVSGGSSTGPEDHAPSLLSELGRLDAHGVSLRPASPTGLGFINGVPVLLLPGNPVSCLCAYDFFGGRLVRRLGGRSPDWAYRSVEMKLSEKLVSAAGRVDYCRVRVEDDRAAPLATHGASILSSTTRADGFVVVPAELEGYADDAVVKVWLYDV
jgi:molybdopterin molybdotransferase